MDPQSAAVEVMTLIRDKKLEAAVSFIRKIHDMEFTFGRYSQQIGVALLGAFPWKDVSKLLPKDCNFFEESGWVKSLEVNAPVNKFGNPIPWLNYSLLDFVTPRLKKSPSVFEWGSGYSTFWWASLGGEVYSVEDAPGWYEKVTEETSGHPHVKINLRLDRDSYINSLRGEWDIIQIDGSYRNECAEVASKHIKNDGLIIFDNSDSPEFSQGVVELMKKGFLRIDFFGLIPTLPYKNCTSLFFRDLCWLSFDLPPSEHYPTPGGISCFQAILGRGESSKS